jgi:hypothetical protein
MRWLLKKPKRLLLERELYLSLLPRRACALRKRRRPYFNEDCASWFALSSEGAGMKSCYCRQLQKCKPAIPVLSGNKARGSVIALNALSDTRRIAVAIPHNSEPKVCAVRCLRHRGSVV